MQSLAYNNKCRSCYSNDEKVTNKIKRAIGISRLVPFILTRAGAT